MTGTRGLVSAALLLLVVLALAGPGCTGTGEPREKVIRVVAAGSLLYPFAQAEERYEALHPGTDVRVEGHGSIQAIRQVTDLGRPFDVVAVADESLIPDLMYRPAGERGRNFSEGYIPFARNEMVIAFTPASRYAGEITAENWPEILSRPDVRVGFSNPMLDAAGYRALMVLVLAGDEYGNPRIFGTIVGNHFDPPLALWEEEGVRVVALPQVMKPSDSHVAIRDGSVFLMSLLEAGGIDYAFEYQSVAEARNFSWVSLSPEINLADPAEADRYGTVKVILGFPRFSDIGRERTGRPIVYALTVPTNAPDPVGGREFVAFVVNESRKGGRGWPAPLSSA
jgi:molybdate/tungstate transport system substrate-binding protein